MDRVKTYQQRYIYCISSRIKCTRVPSANRVSSYAAALNRQNYRYTCQHVCNVCRMRRVICLIQRLYVRLHGSKVRADRAEHCFAFCITHFRMPLRLNAVRIKENSRADIHRYVHLTLTNADRRP